MLNINPVKLARFNPDKLYTSLNGIQVQNSLLNRKAFPKILERNNLSALGNYARHEKINIFISDLGNDMFDDVAIYVNKYKANKYQQFPMKFNETGKGFVETMKSLYTNIENAVKSIS